MNKALEALDRMSIHRFDDNYEEWDKDYEIVENYLETINNAEPSEALECLENLSNFDVVVGKTKKYDISTTVGNFFRREITTVKQALLKSQEQEADIIHYKGTVENLRRDNAILKDIKNEQEKVLKIIFEKRVDIFFIKSCKTVEQYNLEICKNSPFAYGLTQEEFDLVKEMSNNANNNYKQ